MSEALRHTPLYDEHRRAGAKFASFGGFEMPIQYPTGITAEHLAVRTRAGLFDISHMGQLEVHGERAGEFVQRVTSNDVGALEVGQIQYTVLTNEEGGILDDLLVYRFADHYRLIVNAANREKDAAWLDRFTGAFAVEVRDRSFEQAILALQGPAASEIVQSQTEADLDALRYYHFVEGSIAGHPAVISRTGYTGEDGFEFYLDSGAALPVWHSLLSAGERQGLIPAGLGARDTLRLEMGYALYGEDLDVSRTPLEAGLGWVARLETDFIGAEALRELKNRGIAEKLVGFRLLERGFPRAGYEIMYQGQHVGKVTSGTLSPTLGAGIGLAYLPVEAGVPGTRVEVMIRKQPVPAEVVRPPFYTGGSLRR